MLAGYEEKKTTRGSPRSAHLWGPPHPPPLHWFRSVDSVTSGIASECTFDILFNVFIIFEKV